MLDDISNFRWFETCIYWGNHSTSRYNSMVSICMLNYGQKGARISNKNGVPAMRGLDKVRKLSEQEYYLTRSKITS
jgi:hypothetical protein